MSKIKGLEKGYLHTFVTLAFMPAVCGFILSIGLIMYTVLSKALKSMPDHQILQLGGFKVFIGGNLLPGFGSLQEVILALVVMIIIWTAIFGMFKTNTLVTQATSGLEKMGKSLASTAGKGLTMIPIIPTGGKGMSLSSIGKVVNDLPAIVDSYKTKDAEDLRKSLGLHYATEIELSSKTRDLITQLSRTQDPNKRADQIKEIFKEAGTGNTNLAHDSQFQEQLKQFGVSQTVLDNWKTNPENSVEILDALRNADPKHSDEWINLPKTPTSTPEPPAGETTTATGPTVTLSGDKTKVDIKIDEKNNYQTLTISEAQSLAKKNFEEAKKTITGLTEDAWRIIQPKLKNLPETKPAS